LLATLPVAGAVTVVMARVALIFPPKAVLDKSPRPVADGRAFTVCPKELDTKLRERESK
jgi:hypothetical protein